MSQAIIPAVIAPTRNMRPTPLRYTVIIPPANVPFDLSHKYTHSVLGDFMVGSHPKREIRNYFMEHIQEYHTSKLSTGIETLGFCWPIWELTGFDPFQANRLTVLIEQRGGPMKSIALRRVREVLKAYLEDAYLIEGIISRMEAEVARLGRPLKPTEIWPLFGIYSIRTAGDAFAGDAVAGGAVAVAVGGAVAGGAVAGGVIQDEVEEDLAYEAMTEKLDEMIDEALANGDQERVDQLLDYLQSCIDRLVAL